MVTFPPPAPSIAWFMRFLKTYKASGIMELAIKEANEELASPKEFGRFRLVDSKGAETTLSVALEGGGRKIRDYTGLSADLHLSEHGNWRKTHIGTLDAILGKTPFYRHIEAELKKIYSDRQIDTLAGFNMAIFRVLFSFLMEDINVADLSAYDDKSTIIERGKEIATGMKKDISLLQILSDKGKETLLGIIEQAND